MIEKKCTNFNNFSWKWKDFYFSSKRISLKASVRIKEYIKLIKTQTNKDNSLIIMKFMYE